MTSHSENTTSGFSGISGKITRSLHQNVFTSWLICGGWLLLLFFVVFYGIDIYTRSRVTTYDLYFLWELKIPFVPAMFVIYMSVLLLPFLLPFVVSSTARMVLWARQMTVMILIGGILFLLLPAKLGYVEVAAPEWINRDVIKLIAGQHNLLPSLHIALSLITVVTIWPEVSQRFKLLFIVWSLLMAASTLLTHQHHVADGVAGFLLALAVIRYSKRWRTERSSV